MRSIERRGLRAIVVAAVLALIIGVAAGPVAAAEPAPTAPPTAAGGDVGSRGCQAPSASAILDYLSPAYPSSTFSCSGYYYPYANRAPLDFSARGWSGYFTQTDGDLETFCNHDTFLLLGQSPVNLVWLSSVKASWC
jgi:hypothetical protein